MNEIKGDIPQYTKRPDVTPTTPEKKDFLSRIKEQLNALMGEIKGGDSLPQKNYLENLSSNQPSSTENNIEPGYNANATETFHQTVTNTPVEPGPLAPLTDTVPPAAGSGVPINTNPKW